MDEAKELKAFQEAEKAQETHKPPDDGSEDEDLLEAMELPLCWTCGACEKLDRAERQSCDSCGALRGASGRDRSRTPPCRQSGASGSRCLTPQKHRPGQHGFLQHVRCHLAVCDEGGVLQRDVAAMILQNELFLDSLLKYYVVRCQVEHVLLYEPIEGNVVMYDDVKSAVQHLAKRLGNDCPSLSDIILAFCRAARSHRHIQKTLTQHQLREILYDQLRSHVEGRPFGAHAGAGQILDCYAGAFLIETMLMREWEGPGSLWIMAPFIDADLIVHWLARWLAKNDTTLSVHVCTRCESRDAIRTLCRNTSWKSDRLKVNLYVSTCFHFKLLAYSADTSPEVTQLLTTSANFTTKHLNWKGDAYAT
jgi:hypothetical protein